MVHIIINESLFGWHFLAPSRFWSFKFTKTFHEEKSEEIWTQVSSMEGLIHSATCFFIITGD